LDLSKEQQRIFKDLLMKIFDKSIEGLNETLNEIRNLKRRNLLYDLYFYKICNLKINLISIQEQYDSNIRNILYEVKEQKEYIKEILSNTLNQFETNINIEESKKCLNELINEIVYVIDNTSHQLLLKSIFFNFGLFSSIESIKSLFTGTGVLGIVPFRTVFIINSTASEIMFRDKLEELNIKLTWIIQNIQIKKNQQLENLNLYFNNFQIKFIH